MEQDFRSLMEAIKDLADRLGIPPRFIMVPIVCFLDLEFPHPVIRKKMMENQDEVLIAVNATPREWWNWDEILSDEEALKSLVLRSYDYIRENPIWVSTQSSQSGKKPSTNSGAST